MVQYFYVCVCGCSQIKAPVLLMLGGRDRRVSPYQGLELYKALKSRALPVRYAIKTNDYDQQDSVLALPIALFVVPDCCGFQKMDILCPEWTQRLTASSTQYCGCSSISDHKHPVCYSVPNFGKKKKVSNKKNCTSLSVEVVINPGRIPVELVFHFQLQIGRYQNSATQSCVNVPKAKRKNTNSWRRLKLVVTLTGHL